DIRLAQSNAAVALMESRLDAVFITVPRTHDVGFGRVVFLAADRLVGGDRLDHSLHDASLANRPGAMGAAVVPGKKFAIDLEDSDFLLAAVDHLAVAVRVIGHFPRRKFGHLSLPV